ncbi:TraR/DksA C4-type zinc finger protein [Conexibacter sp. CPCC 206217]|uniref:TraR/DksA C4-type zinc finger protein n=1 Tax=Conexibacter sp. CPCC 206217 TaxID=3064574 RepID=UPI00271B3C81|nr:TraR/DksA C4-type zinc finger protein [Conexibacter sp. CPCC 206217]MDO8213221.1 TraR/DksA C4-type zinc finger protein [Conexibacter sp. CPCC 206217]
MDTAHARELLARERARVERELADLRTSDNADEELSHVDQHPGDEGTELFERERDAGFTDQLHDELAAIERAEQRLADGSYGRSVESGAPIPDARLEAVPWAERTVEEQAAYERR